MKQKIFKSKVVDKLEARILDNKQYYINMKENPYWTNKLFEIEGISTYDVESKIEVDPFELVIGGPETDKENAKIVYEHLKKLNPVQAVSDELWTYMTHIQFPIYMANRWKIDYNEDEKKLKEVIKQRYFAIRGGRGIVRNGIARLWWAGYWCYDEKRSDPFELVDVIFDKQEIYGQISERPYNRNKNILIASLETIRDNNLNATWIKMLYKRINSYGSGKQLDALNLEESREMVNELINELKEEEQKDSQKKENGMLIQYKQQGKAKGNILSRLINRKKKNDK